ncbi:hypothetical protein M9H77_30718 [Catharanthus roseus]|uniref:Uncharacterized protein n=1 Tax=Catharanthus roseus TaxID=4058 RepID=A0ACB9ZYF4_CATRO|nr:hypothetical protein M9H77_30718 [Catharanthus roseus]
MGRVDPIGYPITALNRNFCTISPSFSSNSLENFLSLFSQTPIASPHLQLLQAFFSPLSILSSNFSPLRRATPAASSLGAGNILDTEHLATILGIADVGNRATVDSNRKTIGEDPDWNFDEACNCFNIRPQAMKHHQIIHGGDFPYLLHRALAYFFGTSLFKRGRDLVNCSWDEENQVWIPPSEEDRVRDSNLTVFAQLRKLSKPT